MDTILIEIISIFLIIGIGHFLKRIDFLSQEDVHPLNKIVMYVFLPCMIFEALYNADLTLIFKLGILPFAILFSSFITGLISYFILKRLGFDDKKLWSVLITVMIANTAAIGYPITLGIYGEEGFLRAIFCDIASLITFLLLSFVLTLKFEGSAKKSIEKIVLFPPVWALILGILLNLANIPIGGILENTIDYLGQGLTPIIMIALGLSLDLSAIRRSKSMIAFTSIMKLLFFPFIVFLFVSQIGLSNFEFTIPVIQAAMPSAMLSLLLAITYKLDYKLTSDCILINTLVSLITIPIIIMLL